MILKDPPENSQVWQTLSAKLQDTEQTYKGWERGSDGGVAAWHTRNPEFDPQPA